MLVLVTWTAYQNLPLIFQNIPGLTFQSLADRFQRREANGLRPSVLQDGDISHGDADFLGELGDAHLPLRQHDVDVNRDCHVGLVTPLSRSRTLYPRHFVKSVQTSPLR